MRMEHRQILGLVMTKTEELYLEFLESGVQTLIEKVEGSVPQDMLDSIPTIDESLSNHLSSLLPLLRLDGVEEELADYIIYNIDDRGNLLVSDSEMREKFGVPSETIEKVKNLLKAIGPDGLFEGRVVGFGNPAVKIVPDITINEDLSVSVFIPTLGKPNPILEKALEKRRETLIKVGKTMVEVNASFFLGDRLLPRKMNVRDLGRSIGVSTSTASRAVKNKYVSCSRGTFPLKLFFGRSVHPELIKRLIQKVVEDYGNVSDAFIAERIEAMGYKISRRTVNKYRREIR